MPLRDEDVRRRRDGRAARTQHVARGQPRHDNITARRSQWFHGPPEVCSSKCGDQISNNEQLQWPIMSKHTTTVSCTGLPRCPRKMETNKKRELRETLSRNEGEPYFVNPDPTRHRANSQHPMLAPRTSPTPRPRPPPPDPRGPGSWPRPSGPLPTRVANAATAVPLVKSGTEAKLCHCRSPTTHDNPTTGKRKTWQRR